MVRSVRGLVFGFEAVEVVSGWDTIGSVLVWWLDLCLMWQLGLCLALWSMSLIGVGVGLMVGIDVGKAVVVAVNLDWLLGVFGFVVGVGLMVGIDVGKVVMVAGTVVHRSGVCAGTELAVEQGLSGSLRGVVVLS